MSSAPQGPQLHVATRDAPPADHTPFSLEFFARHLLHLDTGPQSEQRKAQATLMALPGLRILWANTATPATWKQTRELLKDDDDELAFLLDLERQATRTRLRREMERRADAGVRIAQNAPAGVRFGRFKHVAVVLAGAELSDLVPDSEAAAINGASHNSGALQLLHNYLEIVRQARDIPDPALGSVVAAHIHDLMALCMGATAECAEVAKRGRGGRLVAIKTAIAENPCLQLAELATQQGVTTRYVQRLFEKDGTTFTGYVVEQRLRRAHGMLVAKHYDHWTISAIAFHVGFGDLSYFNRTFKQGYGATPSRIRAAARRDRRA